MTVVTPGGPCLTQTQIFRDEQQARYNDKLEQRRAEGGPAIQAGGTNPYAAKALKVEAVGGVEKGTSDPQRSYGAPGPHTIDITV